MGVWEPRAGSVRSSRTGENRSQTKPSSVPSCATTKVHGSPITAPSAPPASAPIGSAPPPRNRIVALTRPCSRSGVIAFYGWPLGLKRWPDRPKPIDAASQFRAPVLSIYGGADEGIPEADRKAFAEALKKANVKHEEHVYPGAPHSFFDRKYTEFKDASEDAWKHVQSFVRGGGAKA